MIQGFFSTKRTILTTLLSLVLLGVGGALSSAAPTPSVISYQGFLTSATGTAQTGTTTVTIRIYDAATGGTLLYEELHPTTPITNGYFTVQIGAVGDVNGGTTASSITDLSFDRSYYVTVELASPFATGEMTLAGGTRSQLGTVPFATIAYGTLQATSSSSLAAQKGRMYFNTNDNQLYIYDGSSWNAVGISNSPNFTSLTIASTTANGTTPLLSISTSSSIFTVLANGNIGVGTTTPNAKVYVDQANSSFGLTIGNHVQPRIDLNSTQSGAANWNILNEGNVNRFAIRQTGGGPQFYIESGAVANSLIVSSSSNIGIGSTTPNFKLTVVGGGYFGGNLVATGTLTISGQTTLNTASATGITSTNIYGTNGVITNATATNLFATEATFTNATSSTFFATLLNAVTAIITDLTATNATATNLVTTNSTSTNSFISSLVATLANITDLVVGNSTTTNAYVTNLIADNSSSTNFYTVNFSATNGNFEGLTSTNSTSTNAIIINATATNLGVTSDFYSTGASFLASTTIEKLRITGELRDSNNATGTDGQVLATNGTSTYWYTLDGYVFDGTATNSTLYWNGSTWAENLLFTANPNGNLSASGTLAIYGTSTLATTTIATLTVTGQTTLNTASATGITSTNIYGTNGVITNATATNLFATEATFTNATSSTFFATLLNAVTAIITDLTATNATATNLVTTNSTSTNSFIASLVATLANITDLVVGNSTTTNAVITNAEIANSTTTGSSVVTGTSTLATTTIATLTVTGQTTLNTASATGITSTNIYGTNGVITNATATNLFATEATFTNATSSTFFATLLNAVTAIITDLTATNATATNLVTTNSTSTNSFIASLVATLANITDLVVGNSTTTNAVITNAEIANSTTTGSSVVTGTSTLATTTIATLTVTGQTTLNTASATGITSTNIYGTNGVITNATATNLFATEATFTNATSSTFFATLLNAVTAIITDLTATNATATNLVTTNSTSTNSFIASLVATLANITDLVVGNSTTTNAVITNASTTNLTFVSGTSTGNLAIQGRAGVNPFSVSSSTGESLFTVLENGNVGVGTSTPVARLQVGTSTREGVFFMEDGDVGIGGVPDDGFAFMVQRNFLSNIRNKTASATSTDSAGFNSQRSRGTLDAPSAVLDGDRIGVLSFSGYTGSSFTNGGRIIGLTTEDWTPSGRGLAIAFETVTNGDTAQIERMRIDNSGNIGIGTTSPIATLAITGKAGTNPLTIASSTGASLFSIDQAGKVILANASSSNQSLSGNLDVAGQSALATASATALTVSGKTVLGNASTTALSATTLYGALIGTTGTFSSTLDVTGKTTLGLASSSVLTATNLFSTQASITNASTTGLTASSLYFNNASSTGGLTLASLFGANLTACNSSTEKLLWANGTFTCGTDAGGSGGSITSLNGSSVASQSLATSTIPGVGLDLLITSSTTNGVHTFALSPQAGYNIPLTASSTNWNSFYNTPVSYLTAGANVLFSGTSTISITSNPTFTTGTFSTVVAGTSTLGNASATALTATNLFSTDANITSATSASFFSSLFSATTAFLTTLTATDATFTRATSTDLAVTGNFVSASTSVANLSTTNSTSTNSFIASLVATLANITDLVVGNSTTTNAVITNAVIANATSSLFATLGTTTLALNGGNVGIGTTSPAFRLTVDGSIQILGGNSLTLQNAVGDNSLILTNYGDTGNSRLNIADALYVQEDANVGVGTSTPSYNFTVGGRPGETTSSMGLISNHFATFTISADENNNSATANPAIRFFNDGLYKAEIGIDTDDGGAFKIFTGGAVGFNGGSGITVGTAGNVGIGTTTPNSTLFVQGTSTLNSFTVASSSGTTLFNISATGLTTLSTASTTGAATVGGQLYFTNASSTGGITTTALYTNTLSASGQTILTGASSTNQTISNNLYLSGLTTGSIPFIGTGGLVSQDNSNFFWDNTNDRLGIGSSSPIATLSVRGAGATNPFVVASSTGTTLLSVSQTGLTTLSTASTTGAATIGGQLFFANASSTGGLTLAQTLNVTGQTTLTNASATALTATTLYGTTAFLGTTTNTFDSSKLVVQGTTTLVGTASSPTALKVIGNIDNTFAQDDWPRLVSSTTIAAPSDLVVSDGFVYVISSAELSIYSVADIRNPLLISTSSIDGNDIKVAGNYAYITGSSFFSVVDITDKRAPVQVSSISYGSSYGYITINGQYAYVSSSVENSLKVIDISNPLEPRVVTSLSVGSSPRDLVVSNTVLYVVDHNNGNLYSFDISDPLNPVLLDTLSVAFGLQSVKVSGGYVYVQRFTGGGLYIVDGSSPADLVQIASVGTGGGSNDLKIAGGYAYVPNYNAHTISVVDIRNPYSPTLVKNISTSNNPTALSVDGNNLYVANYGSGEVSFYELPSLESVSALIHSLETGNLSVRNSLTTSGLLSVGTGLTVGSGGFLSRGNSSVYGSFSVGTSTYSNFLVNAANNTTNIGTSTGLASLFVQGTSTLNAFTVASSTGSSLFTVLANGNVGIGTSSPDANLTLSGLGNTSALIEGAGVPSLSFKNGFSGSGIVSLYSDNSLRVGVESATNTSHFVISSSADVGIGTSDPTTQVQAAGSPSFQGLVVNKNFPTLVLKSNNGSTYRTSIYNTYGDTVFSNHYASGNLIFNNAGSEVFRLTSTGNIGIGTTTPIMKLVVESNVVNEGVIISNTDTTGGASVPLFLSSMASATSTNVNIENLEGSFALRTGATTLSDYGLMRMIVNTLGDFSFGGTPSLTPTSAFRFTGRAGLDVFSVASSSEESLFLILQNGNIGIGTTTPAAKLTIQGGNDSIDPFAIASSSGASMFTLLANGNVGISTSTPGSRLDVYDSTSSSDIDIFRIITDVGSAGNVKFRIDSDGDVFTDGGTTIGTPADLAENYPTLDDTMVPGMVVSLSSSTLPWAQSLPNGSTTDYEIATVKKAERGEDPLGVISTRPGILLGGNTERGTPVAFSGRVPVYVSNENGVVQKGDPLTISSSTPGYAMKQTLNGQSIGRALSSQDPSSTSSLVMMVVENTNRTVTITDIEGLSLLASSSTLPATTVRETLTERLQQGYSVVREYVAVTVRGVSGYFDTLFAGQIYSDTICVKKSNGTNVCFNGDQIENVLNATNIPLLQNNPTVSGSTTENSNPASDDVILPESTPSDDNGTTTPPVEEVTDNVTQSTEDTSVATESEELPENPLPEDMASSTEE